MVDNIIIRNKEVIRKTLTAEEEKAWNNRQPSNDFKLKAIRHIRQRLLQETDVWVLKGNIQQHNLTIDKLYEIYLLIIIHLSMMNY